MAKQSSRELGCEGSLLSAPGLFPLILFFIFLSVPFHLLYAPLTQLLTIYFPLSILIISAVNLDLNFNTSFATVVSM